MSIQREVSSGNAADWDPLLAMDHNMSFIGSVGFSSLLAGVPEFHGVDDSSFSSKSFSVMASSLPLSESPTEFPSVADHGMDKDLKGKKRKVISEFGAPHARCSPMNKIQKLEVGQQKNVSSESMKSPRENDDKKSKNELNAGCNGHKLTSKQSKDNSENGDAKKEDYIHVRAKRGQATNSHSLAERVRREKISERMRLLQDLVPGCNKLTGKAMMLDEIINYVQSLQRQVEFLSMKLAAVNPEMNFDIEQILPKDILQSQDGNSAALGFGQAMNISHQQFHGLMQTDLGICNMPSSGGMIRLNNHEISPMAQIPSVWDHDIHNLVPMGFITNPPIASKEMNGSMKVEL
ncbi:hypothetical protein J5N97_008613 [Dioscorea zingiberensis]|uniref:BHLH domain-containing protein n=1 Tax=Dioscorea zingiberensis TaxID=325984 RepID=A0A9D5HL12_9LILI|nr:hypothetical protein J5N97_008613 [Dioscorea zingiberensis]